ncbi:MAG: HAD family hydrolase [Alphaproteobacteria bacterium]|nr:HAD family hydrolase [Alphaproteobacteria bacterium]
MNVNKKHIFWDWNCTLLDDAQIILDCVNISLAKWAPSPLTMEQFRQIPSTSLHDLYRMAGVAEKDIPQALDEERDLFHDNYEPRADSVPLRKGAANLLQNLKTSGVGNVIVSNHIANQIVRLLKLREIRQYFDEVLAYRDRSIQFRGTTKIERLQTYAKNNAVDLSSAAIVGDTVEEIEIGHAAGLCSIAITGGLTTEENLRKAKPHHLVHSLDELGAILRERRFVA